MPFVVYPTRLFHRASNINRYKYYMFYRLATTHTLKTRGRAQGQIISTRAELTIEYMSSKFLVNILSIFLLENKKKRGISP